MQAAYKRGDMKAVEEYQKRLAPSKSNKQQEEYQEMLDLYDSLSFYNLDGTLNLVACPRYQTQILCKHGLEANNTTQRFDGGIQLGDHVFQFRKLNVLTAFCHAPAP